MIQFGTNPIAWANDDDHSLGIDIPTAQILHEAAEIGFDGIENGHRWPDDPAALKSLLDGYGLRFISGWYSLNLLTRSVEAEKRAIQPHLDKLKYNGCAVCIACETSNSIQGLDRPLSESPALSPDEMAGFGAKVEALAAFCADQGIALAYHHHMGTVVETPDEIDAFMAATGPATKLLFDAGHCYFGAGGADPTPVLRKHIARVAHFHAKNVRPAVMAEVHDQGMSFMDGVRANVFTVPGDLDGGVDFAPLLGLLKASGYHGWIVIEAEQDPAVRTPRHYQSLGLATLKTLSHEVGLDSGKAATGLDGNPGTADAVWLNARSCDIAAFEALISQSLSHADAPQAAEILHNVPVYDMDTLRPALGNPDACAALQAEWADVLRRTAGVVVLRAAYADTAPIDEATAVFDAIIAEEKARSDGGGDHFAAAGANDRVWNSAQKLCLRAPETFARYFGSPAIAAICEAWLGPDYQMTAQVNLVRPGGAAQQVHRDYHLGFQTEAMAARYPVHAHELTAALTLQGAVAHTDMPIESGPTKLMPFSQACRGGYLAFHHPEFRKLFEARCVQLPLKKGDAVFFNPALFHAAGANTSVAVQRMANLLQVSSAFGRAMESLDRVEMARVLYAALASLVAAGRMGPAEADAAIAAAAEGYPFPTNLDTDPPVGGNAPESEAGLMRRALAAGWNADDFSAALAERVAKRSA